MKKNIKDLFILLFFCSILFTLLTNYNIIIKSIQNSVNLWLTKLFPSIFPFMVLGTILINLNIASFFKKFFKLKNNSVIVMLMSALSGFPSNAKYTKQMYLNYELTLKNANSALCFSHFSNPLFLLSTLSLMFNKKWTIAIILSHYLANIIIYLFISKDNSQEKLIFNNNSLGSIISSSIKDSINTMLLILGTLTFYTIIITIGKIYFANDLIITIFTGFLEFSSGLNSLLYLDISFIGKAILATSFISFGSLGIHTQIKSILNDTPIKFSKFFICRLIHVLLSIILLLIFYLFT